MTKYSILVYHKEYDWFLDRLRSLGIAHIIENNQEVSEEIHMQFQNITSLNKTIRFLEKLEINSSELLTASDLGNGEKIFIKINQLKQDKEYLLQKKNIINKQISELEPWGDFDLDLLEKLKINNINLRLYTCASKKFEENWNNDHELFQINTDAGQIYFAIIDQGKKEIEINAEEISIPDYNISSLTKLLQETDNQLNEIENSINSIAYYGLDELNNYKKRLIDEIELKKALHNTISEVNDSLKIIEIWCPEDKLNDIDSFLKENNSVFLKSAPSKDDKVPIKLKNKKFHKDFEQIGEMYSLPKYGELDLTPFFAPFYALFFGFCLGDIGYGFLMVIAAFIFRSKVSKTIKPTMNLIAYLGTATVLFGMIGGTFFGINLYQTNLPIYSNLQDYFDANNTDINNFLFYLSLAFGGLQIIFGLFLKLINEIKQLGWKLAIGTLGWITLILGMISIHALGEYSELSENILSGMQNTILTISGLMILVFNNLTRKVYINIGVGLWDSYNMITGILGDLLSYIRLFALGISSAILGFVFNSLAVSMSGDIPVLSIIIMIIILVIGHSINIFMSGLGAFVHPMRLTFVEFYKNAGFTGGGKKYHPFKKLIITKEKN